MSIARYNYSAIIFNRPFPACKLALTWLNDRIRLRAMKPADTVIDYKRIRQARGERTVQSVTEALNITRQTLWQIETGRAAPTGDTLAKLCIFYKVRVEDVVKTGAIKQINSRHNNGRK
jgi:DNA-binding XRE family transcriptional regulator